MDPTTRPRRTRSWRGPPLSIKARRPSLSPPMASTSRLAAGGSQSLTIVYTVEGSDHYAVIPYPRTYEEALTAAVQRFSQYFASAGPSRQVWLAKGLRTRRNRWIWAELNPETFLQSIEDSAAEIRLCDNEQDEFDSDDDSDCLSVIFSEEDEGHSVQTGLTSLVHDAGGPSKSGGSCASSQSISPSNNPVAITQALIDEAVHIYHSTTDFATATAKLEHAASVAPAAHPDLKAQCYLHLGYLAQISSSFPSTPTASSHSPITKSPKSPTPKSPGRSPSTPSFSNARSHFRHAQKLFTQSQNRHGQMQCKQAVASVALDEQDWDSARSQILYMVDAGKRDGVDVDEVWCWSALALIAMKQGVAEDADTFWGKAWSAGAS